MRRIFLVLAVLSLPLFAYAGETVTVATQGTGKYAAVSVGTAATKITAGVTVGRKNLTFFNNGTATEYCGFDTSVTTTTGFPVAAAAAFSADYGSGVTVYCIVASGTNDNRVLEVL